MRSLSVLAACLLLLIASAGQAQTLYATNGSNLVTVNTSTGATTTVGPTRVGATNVFITGMAFQGSSSTTFCSIGNDSNFGRQICTINLSTAAVTLLPTVNPWVITDISFAPNGTLYGMRKLSGTVALVSINLSTGAATQIGSAITMGTQGNAFAISAAGVAYWFAGDGILRTVNLTTGAATTGPSLTGGVATTSFPAAVFSPTGTLFASQGGADQGLASLVTVNPSTGVVTQFGSVFADALAFNAAPAAPVSGPPTAANGVPVSPAALALMAAALGGLAMWQLRRRAAAN